MFSQGCVAMQVLAETGEYLSHIMVENGVHEHLFYLLEQKPISTTLQELASECLFVLTSMPSLKSNMLLFACKKGLAKVSTTVQSCSWINNSLKLLQWHTGKSRNNQIIPVIVQ